MAVYQIWFILSYQRHVGIRGCEMYAGPDMFHSACGTDVVSPESPLWLFLPISPGTQICYIAYGWKYAWWLNLFVCTILQWHPGFFLHQYRIVEPHQYRYVCISLECGIKCILEMAHICDKPSVRKCRLHQNGWFLQFCVIQMRHTLTRSGKQPLRESTPYGGSIEYVRCWAAHQIPELSWWCAEQYILGVVCLKR